MINLSNELKKYSSERRKKSNERFFKTGIGEYSEGDIFIGVSVPDVRRVALKFYKDISLDEVKILLDSKIHEERLLGLEILNNQYQKQIIEKDKIFNFYIENIERINNWDLVDGSAPDIIGDYISNKKRDILYTFAKSKSLWIRRISIISTLKFIRMGDIEDCLKLSKIHLNDSEDLMHKAVGWMLREAWKKNSKKVEDFLKENYSKVPRTTLRYAIERMEEPKRKRFLKGEV